MAGIKVRERKYDANMANTTAMASGVNKKEIASCYRLLVNELDLKISIADPAECLARVAQRAKVGPKVEADAREILSEAEKAGITAGLYPTGLAASALYLASLLDGQWMTQSSAAEAAGGRGKRLMQICRGKSLDIFRKPGCTY